MTFKYNLLPLKNIPISLVIILVSVGACIPDRVTELASQTPDEQFSGDKAFSAVEYQVSLGPRLIGSQAHEEVRGWIISELKSNHWVTETQSTMVNGFPITNIIGKRNLAGKSWVILGAHYDSRFFADQDSYLVNRNKPVLGANDGASGVGVLVELSRVIPEDIDQQIWLVFFDAEDNGGIGEWDWILGSRIFVQRLTGKPDLAVIVDMVGDADLNIYFERYSDAEIAKEIWDTAAHLGYINQFVPEEKYAILDDHIPFIEAGIPAVDIIDFDYPYWHTTEDTLDKVSPQSLEAVGRTLQYWLVTREHTVGIRN